MLGVQQVAACIAVKDMAMSAKFYEETLELEKSVEYPGGVYYKAGDSGILVYPSTYAGSNQATYAALLVDDVDATVAELKAKNVKFEQYDDLPGTRREGDIHIMGEMRAAWCKDPDGNILSIVNQIG
jgi:predicted enzyme related to lactoylglutathione lyase